MGQNTGIEQARAVADDEHVIQQRHQQVPRLGRCLAFRGWRSRQLHTHHAAVELHLRARRAAGRKDRREARKLPIEADFAAHARQGNEVRGISLNVRAQQKLAAQNVAKQGQIARIAQLRLAALEPAVDLLVLEVRQTGPHGLAEVVAPDRGLLQLAKARARQEAVIQELADFLLALPQVVNANHRAKLGRGQIFQLALELAARRRISGADKTRQRGQHHACRQARPLCNFDHLHASLRCRLARKTGSDGARP